MVAKQRLRHHRSIVVAAAAVDQEVWCVVDARLSRLLEESVLPWEPMKVC